MARLKTRLAALEGDTIEGNADASRLLIQLTAKRDALFWPWRAQRNFAAIRKRQKAYLDFTEGISAKADGQSDWKPSHAARRVLIETGRCTASYSSGQITGLFITEQGDIDARTMIGRRLRTLNESLVLYVMAKHHAEANPERKEISESDLFGEELTGDPSQWEDATELILPLLVRGYVSASSDGEGRVYYLADPTASERMSDRLYESECLIQPNADNCYLAAYEAERSRLSALDVDTHEIFLPSRVT